LVWVLLLCVAWPRPAALAAADGLIVNPRLFFGACNASGAVPVGTNLVLVADDENNTLRLYRSDMAGLPVKEYDMDAFLGVRLEGKSLEADLEAGARIGDRAFWIGSHGRNKGGKERSNRHRFFATDISAVGGEVRVVPVGVPCRSLIEELCRDRRFDRFAFTAAAAKAPKLRDALNIEGLAATPEGGLLIGFRNPVPEGRALLIPLLNPNEVVEGRPARFGDALLIDLGGLGIRDIALVGRRWVIIAGAWHGGGPFELYFWDGPGTKPKPYRVKHLGDYQPEAVIVYPDRGLDEFQILSDDGNRVVDGVISREIPDAARQCFRGFWVVPNGR